MGRSTTPKYVYEFRIPGHYVTPAEWRVRTNGQNIGYGKPTDENLAKHVRIFEESTRDNGCNAHLGATTITSAVIRTNDAEGTVLATYNAVEMIR